MVARNSASAASGSRITATPSGYCSGAVARVARVVGGAIAHRVGDGRAHIRVKTVEQRVLRAGPGLVRRGVDRLDDHGAQLLRAAAERLRADGHMGHPGPPV